MSHQINRYNSSPSRNLRFNTFPQLSTTSDQFKTKILSQNKALAKKNSVLMTKVADLETKISELIQQNIELRAINAKSDDQKRKWLEDKLNVIESGVSQRFEEMFQMFSTIRNNEGLASSSINLQNLVQNVSSTDQSSEKTVSFHDVKSPSKSYISDRRRKSSRRQSIYVPPPQSPEIEAQRENSIEELERGDLPVAYDSISPFNEEQPDYSQALNFQDQQVLDEGLIPEEQEPEQELQQKSLEQIDQEQGDQHEQMDQSEPENHQSEFEHAAILSPIKFSSPRKPESNPKFSVYVEPDNDSKITSEEDLQAKIQKLSDESVSTSHTTAKEPISILDDSETQWVELDESKDKADDLIIQDAAKIKHTKSKKQKSKSSKDESMPIQISSELSTRKSRTRGKSVNYAEPSLRKKMRRESEQLTDAVVEYDDYIKSEPSSRPTSANPPSIDEHILKASRESPIKAKSVETEEPVEQVIQKPVVEQQVIKPVEVIKKRQAPLTEQDSVNVTKRRKPLATLNQNQNQNQNKTSKKDKDIKPTKKMQLDINAAELSVFDLVDECEVGVPKTYKGTPDTSVKKTRRQSVGNNAASRRHSSLL